MHIPCIAFIFVGYCLVTFSIDLMVQVRTDLHSNVGDVIDATLAFVEGFPSSSDVTSSKTCMSINGNICYCFPDLYKFAKLVWTQNCVSMKSSVEDTIGVYSIALHLYTPKYESVPQRIISTSPKYYTKHTSELNEKDNKLTLLLPLTIDDIGQASVLFQSLQKIHPKQVKELLVFVPDIQLQLLDGAIMGLASACKLNFKVKVQKESKLFHSTKNELKGYYPYAIQMAIKLLAADYITTNFYMTLDADMVQLREFNLSTIILNNKKAVYHFEPRSVHENWWVGSERLLNINPYTSYPYHAWKGSEYATCLSASNGDTSKCSQSSEIGSTQRAVQGFGVTPAILSTYGSQLTVSHLCRHLTGNYAIYVPIDRRECETKWLGGFGQGGTDPVTGEESVSLWSEYTLYRIVLDHYEVFDELHISEQEVSTNTFSKNTDLTDSEGIISATQDNHASDTQLGLNDDNIDNNGVRLHCYNVWFAGQLPWQAGRAKLAKNCLFSVVQSTSGVSPSAVLKLYNQYFL